ncbi:hypothetical protein D3C72_1096670 [compost metagenome]
MLQALAQLGDGDDGHKLARGHTDQHGHQHQNAVGQDIVQQVVAVVAPHRHLALRMVQRMQLPPPDEAVLATVDPVGHKVENHQIHQEADPGHIGHARPECVYMPGLKPLHAQAAYQPVPQGVDGKKERQAEQPQAVDQCVENIDADGVPVGHRLHRAPALQRRNHQHHDDNLQATHQKPASGGVAIFQKVGQAHVEQQRLEHLFKHPLLGIVKKRAEEFHS